MHTEQTHNPDGQFESVRDVNKELIPNIDADQPPLQTIQQQQQKPSSPINQELRGNIIRELSLNRKSEGFEQSKQAHQHIINGARQHILCVNIVLEQLDQKIIISDKSLQTISSFFKERLIQERSNIQLLTKNNQFLGIYKFQEKPLYPKLTQSLEYLNQLHQSQGKSLSLLVQSMEKMIKDFDGSINKKSKDLNLIIDKINGMKKQIKDHSLTVNEKIKKFLKIYDEMMANGGIHKKRSKDIFNQDIKFKQFASQQLLFQNKLGEEVIVYYNEVLKQETQRIELIIEGLKFYLEKFHETYSGTSPSAQVQLVLKKFSEYNPLEESSQIDFQQIQFIKEALKCEEIGFPQLKNYLASYPLSLLKQTLAQTNPFVLKFFQHLQRDVGTMLTKWQGIIAVVSIDRHLLIFDSENTTIPNQKASFKFAIENTSLTTKSNKGGLIIGELKHTIPGMIYNSHQAITLKFNGQDQYEELQFYLTQNKK